MSNQLTEVRLLSVPLESDYKHTLYFSSLTEQLNYFTALPATQRKIGVSYQRKDHFIAYPAHYDDISNYNYVMYNNGRKYYYAFITEMKYVNDERTDIYIETDVLQTYMFDYVIKESFVEREHCNDDTIGIHTIPENLEMGEYVCENMSDLEDLSSICYIIGTTKTTTGANVEGTQYNGIFSGIRYYYFHSSYVVQMINFIKSFDVVGAGEAIQCIFTAPWEMIPKSTDDEGNVSYSGTVGGTLKPWKKRYDTEDFGGRSRSFIGYGNMYDGYSPKNNKCLTFPYKYLLVTNNNGGEGIYKYEEFRSGIEFEVEGSLTPGCSIRINPFSYKMTSDGLKSTNIEGINLGKYPICNWTSDIYTNWLTQNSVNIGLSVASGGLQIIGGVATSVAMGIATGGVGALAGAGGISSGATQIANTLGQVHQMSFTPPQSKGNINCGDVVTSDKSNTFTFMHMSIKPEYARIIDNYFTMFGYKTNRLKVPNTNHRSNFWYTKTIDIDIEGSFNAKDMQKIKDCYNRGITFWRNASRIGNYGGFNSIVEE